jgi:hypothetical protein
MLADGRNRVDRPSATVDSLRLPLTGWQKVAVDYYHEVNQNGAAPAPIVAMQTMVGNRLPVELSSRPDFSDATLQDGKPIIRDPNPSNGN